MKKYISAILINALLIQFVGCYSMQKVTKDEFLQASDHPELFIKTKEKEFKFKEGSYTFQKDTIFGNGEFIMRSDEKYLYEPFEGRISINDVEKIETDKMNNASDTTNLIVKTKDKEFIFKFDESSYSVKNDTIFGKGITKARIDPEIVDESFEGAISINDVEEIKAYKFNSTNVIALGIFIVAVAVLVVSVYSSADWQVSY